MEPFYYSTLQFDDPDVDDTSFIVLKEMDGSILWDDDGRHVEYFLGHKSSIRSNRKVHKRIVCSSSSPQGQHVHWSELSRFPGLQEYVDRKGLRSFRGVRVEHILSNLNNDLNQ